MKHVLSLVIPILLTVFLVSSCIRRPPAEHVTLKPLHIWELEGLTNSNSPNCVTVYNNTIYYVRETPESFLVRRMGLEGTLLSEFAIPLGKGPGEALHSMGLAIDQSGIYFCDLHLKRISRFDFEGRYQDCMDFGPESGIILYFALTESFIYTTTMDSVFLGKIDKASGRQTAFIRREGPTETKIGGTFTGGPVKYDPFNGEIYMGLAGKPYTILRFDKDLNPLGRLTYPLEKEFKPIRVYPGPRPAGDFTVLSMAVTEEYLYAPHISARYQMKENRPAALTFSPEILRFSKENFRVDRRFSIQGLKSMKGEFSVLYADDSRLIVLASGTGEWVSQLYPESPPEYTNTVLILSL